MSQFPNQPPYRQGQAGQSQPSQIPAGQGQPYYPPQPQTYHRPVAGQSPTTNNLPYPPVYTQPPVPAPQPNFVQPNLNTTPKTASFQTALAVFLAYSFLIVGQVPADYAGFTRLSFLGILAAIASFSGAIAIYRVEKKNQFIRFHALQALALGLCWTLLTLLIEILDSTYPLGFTPFIQAILFIIYIYIIASTIYRVACRNEDYKIPIVGKIAQFFYDPEA